MPTYDYRCRNCEHAWEAVLPMADFDIPCQSPCPECGAEQSVERFLGGAPGFSYTYGGAKTPDTFKDVLRKIKKSHAHSTIDV